MVNDDFRSVTPARVVLATARVIHVSKGIVMRWKKWVLGALLALPLPAAGYAYGQSLTRGDEPQESAGYVCLLTGEELPCPNCCPMNGK